MENEVLEAFEAIHALNVVHGDIRSSNILVAEDGNEVRIIDFEDAKILGDGDEESESEMSNEMEVVNDMLRDIKKSRAHPACNRLPESELPNGTFPPLEVY